MRREMRGGACQIVTVTGRWAALGVVMRSTGVLKAWVKGETISGVTTAVDAGGCWRAVQQWASTWTAGAWWTQWLQCVWPMLIACAGVLRQSRSGAASRASRHSKEVNLCCVVRVAVPVPGRDCMMSV